MKNRVIDTYTQLLARHNEMQNEPKPWELYCHWDGVITAKNLYEMHVITREEYDSLLQLMKPTVEEFTAMGPVHNWAMRIVYASFKQVMFNLMYNRRLPWHKRVYRKTVARLKAAWTFVIGDWSVPSPCGE